MLWIDGLQPRVLIQRGSPNESRSATHVERDVGSLWPAFLTGPPRALGAHSQEHEKWRVVGRFIARLFRWAYDIRRSMRHVRRTAEIELLQAGVIAFLRDGLLLQARILRHLKDFSCTASSTCGLAGRHGEVDHTEVHGLSRRTALVIAPVSAAHPPGRRRLSGSAPGCRATA